jgi:hypothetical protein
MVFETILPIIKQFYVKLGGTASDVANDRSMAPVLQKMIDYISPSSEKQDVLTAGHGIDINDNVISSVINHSTAHEQVIGTWINGKPLYQKSFSITLPDNVNLTTTGIDCTGFDNVVKIECTIELNGYSYTFNGNWYRTNNERISMYFRRSPAAINVYTGNTFLNLPCVVTVQYTKTTD